MPIINITQNRQILYVWKFAVPIVLIHCTIKIASNNITSFFFISVQYYKDRNIEVIPWTINDPIEKKYFEEVLGLKTYMTDSFM